MLLEVIYALVSVLTSLRSLSRNARSYERVFYAFMVAIPLILSQSLLMLTFATAAWWMIFSRYFFLHIMHRTTTNTAMVWTAIATFTVFALSYNISLNIWGIMLPVLAPAAYAIVLGMLLYVRFFIK
jgi:hypothetical protein